MNSSQVGAYAIAPEVQIVENSLQAQAVRELQLGLLAVNFWNDSPRTVDFVSCSAPASVISREQSGELVLAVSDPTQTNTGRLVLTLARSASKVAFADTNITVTSLTPTIQLSVNVDGKEGLSSTVKFRLEPAK
jgi:hyaluronate lyase